VGKLAKLRDLAGKAARWLGLDVPATHTSAVAADRFDDMTWHETLGQARALQDLTGTLAERSDYAADLVRDVFLAAVKASPQLRDRSAMDPSRLVNHQVLTALLETPEFTELRRESAGDPYAAAMAVLSLSSRLQTLLEQARHAQDAASAAAAARQDADAAREAVRQALEQAAAQADSDDGVPGTAARSAAHAMAQAEAADQVAAHAMQDASGALAAITAAARTAMRAAAADAAAQARSETALMHAWGVDPGQLRRMPFEERRRLAERLRGSRLGSFAALIGRFRAMAQAERARKTEHAPGELTGIEQSDDLAALIPSELAALGVPAMRAAFAVRMSERRLFTYATRGEEHAGHGAIIAAIDCSGSMAEPSVGGLTREAWAKACALALLDQARAGKRDFAAVLFGSATELKVYQFPRGQAAIGEVLDFAEFFWDGGTDFEAPLSLAADLLEAEYNQDGRQRGDIVLITDGECGVSETWMRAYHDRKAALGYRTFGIALGGQPGPVLTALSDNLRSIHDLADTSVARDIFRVT